MKFHNVLLLKKKHLTGLLSILIFILIVYSCKNSGIRGKDKQEAVPSQAMKQGTGDPPAEQLLRDAAFNGNFEKLKEVVNKKLNINALDQDGRSALMYAAFNGHNEIVNLLLKKGADINIADYAGRTALLFAASGDFPETVKLLLDNNANPNIVDREERFSALMFAAAEGHLEVVKILLQYNADPDLKDKDGDDAASFAMQNGHQKVAEFLRSYKR